MCSTGVVPLAPGGEMGSSERMGCSGSQPGSIPASDSCSEAKSISFRLFLFSSLHSHFGSKPLLTGLWGCHQEAGRGPSEGSLQAGSHRNTAGGQWGGFGCLSGLVGGWVCVIR